MCPELDLYDILRRPKHSIQFTRVIEEKAISILKQSHMRFYCQAYKCLDHFMSTMMTESGNKESDNTESSDTESGNAVSGYTEW